MREREGGDVGRVRRARERCADECSVIRNARGIAALIRAVNHLL